MEQDAAVQNLTVILKTYKHLIKPKRQSFKNLLSFIKYFWNSYSVEHYVRNINLPVKQSG